MMSELKAYTKEELEAQQQLFDEVFTPAWENEGQYCRAGGGQYEKSFAWWAFKHQQQEVYSLQDKVLLLQGWEKIAHSNGEDKRKYLAERDVLQKLVDAEILNIEAFFDEQSGHPSQRDYANFLADILYRLKGE